MGQITVRGTSVAIDRAQLMQIAEALAAEPDMTFGGDPDGSIANS
ncbi:MAG: hypothetical protein ACR2MP_09465 [Streptosporangiaceae bacterium]